MIDPASFGARVSDMAGGSLSELLEQAVKLYREGMPMEARRVCERILGRDARYFDALHLLGVISAQTGMLSDADELMARAITVDPTVAEAHNNRGNVLRLLLRLEEALASYDGAIALSPGYADALTHRDAVLKELQRSPDASVYFNRGNVLREAHRLEEALANYDRAIALKSDYAEAHNNRGIIQQERRQLHEALTSYDRAIAIFPDYALAYNNRGNVLQELQRLEEALASYDKAIVFEPDFAGAFNNRGNVLAKLQRREEALTSYGRALSLEPDYAEAHNNRGQALRELKRLEEALVSHERAIFLKADFAEAHNNRGNALLELNRLDEALASYDRAIALNADYIDVHFNRGNALQNLGRLEEALASYDRAIGLKSDYSDAYNNRGITLQDLRCLEVAVVSYDKAIALRPGFVEAKHNKALAVLLRGGVALGFDLYEWRKQSGARAGDRKYRQPVWLGAETLAGKTILVHWEQGLGDTLQFCRYVGLLEQAGAKVLFAPQKSLRRLMRSLSATVEIVDEADPALAFDVHCPLLSLPLAFKTDLASIPGKSPYLGVEDGLVERWRERIGSHGFKIGICWQGATSKIDAGRSFPLAALYPIARLAGVRLISLHKGAGEAQLQSLPEGMTVETLGADFDAGPDAFLDSAAVMKNLDLVISSDTAIAHLAGALAVPVWIALKHVPDWRWMLDRADSPWYPTARLFRQRVRDDWSDVFVEIEKELSMLVKGGDGRASAPPSWPSAPRVAVSWGELIDKLTILEIKSVRLSKAAALSNVRRELGELLPLALPLIAGNVELAGLKDRLRQINEALWEIEDRIREKEAARQFDKAFIELARSVYCQNDQRATLKRQINVLLVSEVVEEKLYTHY